MGALLRVIGQIAMLRQGPQVLPASTLLLWLALIAHWLTGVVLGSHALPLDGAFLSSLVGTLTMVAVVHGLLLLHRRHSRVLQTLTALAACETLLGLVAIPVSVWFNMGGGLQDVAVLLSLLLFGWNIAIASHILRHALGVSRGMGFLFAVGYTLVSITLGSFLVPVEG
ncbi:MAG: hypothetical protein OQK94_07940 [Gammaproteobacteria bacterium]|nr:hypothetical protein [Gammaproteobacteria bacterium]MCW8840330.1 hypothetical protein [Gammaproteobacteria bacterium]MCW8927966.1 hypothetical protein [Gammaproteobacteria bacterium]MCW8957748.1 hypothetical protein [Gammaproteobacteria bacterium]MCW8972975.1 hypothetical protein [Gammaproteobacteria bacterium]